MPQEKLNTKSFTVTFEISRSLGARTRIHLDESFLHQYYGRIKLQDETEVGSILVSRILAEQAVEHGMSLFSLMDLDAQYLRIYEELMDIKTDEWKLLESEFHTRDFLIIEHVKVQPNYRGHDLGLRVALSAMELFGPECSYAFIIPFPAGDTDGRLKGSAKKAAFKSIQSYWKRVGFERVGRTDIFYWDLLSRGLPKISKK